MAEDV